MPTWLQTLSFHSSTTEIYSGGKKLFTTVHLNTTLCRVSVIVAFIGVKQGQTEYYLRQPVIISDLSEKYLSVKRGDQ